MYTLPSGLGSLAVYKIGVSENQVVLWIENYIELPLNDLPNEYAISDKDMKQNTNNYARAKLPNGKPFMSKIVDYKSGEIASADGKTRIALEMSQAFGSSMVTAFDDDGNIYVLVEELADPCPVVTTEVTIRKYDIEGKMIGVAKLPIENYILYPNKPVYITNDGRVFIMVPTEKNYPYTK